MSFSFKNYYYIFNLFHRENIYLAKCDHEVEINVTKINETEIIVLQIYGIVIHK